MAYCKEVDVSNAATKRTVRQLTDDAQGSTIESVIVTQAIAWADDRINGYLRAQHDVPITPVPALVKQMSIDLTVYRLYNRRLDRGIPDSVEFLFERNEKTLEKINKGLIQLSDSTSIASTGGFYAGNKTSSSQVNTDTNLNKFYDPDDM